MDRRGFLAGLGALIAAPAIVRYTNLMPVRRYLVPVELQLPSGLWVKVTNILTGREEFLEAEAAYPSYAGKGVDVKFESDNLIRFDHVTIGRDENELFYTPVQDLTIGFGDTCRINVSLV